MRRSRKNRLCWNSSTAIWCCAGPKRCSDSRPATTKTAPISGGIQITRGRHSGRASPCEREPEFSKRRGSFLHEVLTRHSPSQASGRGIMRISRPVFTGFRLFAPKRRSAGMTTHGFDSVISARVLTTRIRAENAAPIRMARDQAAAVSVAVLRRRSSADGFDLIFYIDCTGLLETQLPFQFLALFERFAQVREHDVESTRFQLHLLAGSDFEPARKRAHL